jgi:hypothetical protein
MSHSLAISWAFPFSSSSDVPKQKKWHGWLLLVFPRKDQGITVPPFDFYKIGGREILRPSLIFWFIIPIKW